MTREEFQEKLAEAGNKFDGHVTHGSIEEQTKLIERLFAHYRWESSNPYSEHWREKPIGGYHE